MDNFDKLYDGMTEVRDLLLIEGYNDEIITSAVSAYLYAVRILDENLFNELMEQIEVDVENNIWQNKD